MGFSFKELTFPENTAENQVLKEYYERRNFPQ